MKGRPSQLQIFLVLAVGVVAISWASLLIRWCSLPPLTIAAWRLLFATGFVTVGSWRLPRPPSIRQGVLGAIAGVCLASHFATWITSLGFLPVSISVVLVTTSPIFTALLARFFLKEQLGKSQIVGIALAALGAAGMTPLGGQNLGPEAAKGCILALAGAVSVAGYFVIGKRCQLWDLRVYLVWVYGWAALTLVLACLVSGAPLWGYSSTDWGWLLLLGLIPQGIGHSALNWGLRFAGSAQISVTVLGEPIGATVLAWIFLREPLGSKQALFGALILAGVALTLRRPQARRLDDPA